MSQEVQYLVEHVRFETSKNNSLEMAWEEMDCIKHQIVYNNNMWCALSSYIVDKENNL
jgi:hypothetical protein